MSTEHRIARALITAVEEPAGPRLLGTHAVVNRIPMWKDPSDIPSAATVQRVARKMTKDGPWRLDSRWEATYSRGVFTVRERVGYKPPTEYDPPDWFEAPSVVEGKTRRWSSFDVGQKHCLAYQLAKSCISGGTALAPWQRSSVWTEDQQVALLDSMIRGLSIGAFTLWHRPRGSEGPRGRAMPGCADPRPDAELIVDGQQRATTLVKAALGELDHWRWNGVEWTRGKGFMTPKIALMDIGGMGTDMWRSWGEAMIKLKNEGHASECWKQAEIIERTDLDVMVLGGTAAEMIETYRRLATHGSPHSPEDLAVMEEWASANLDVGQ